MKIGKLSLEKEQAIFFGFILLLCVIAIGIAIYFGFFEKEDNLTILANEVETEEGEVTQQDFDTLFDNQLHTDGNNVGDITKIDGTKDIIVANYAQKAKEEGKYELNVTIPIINIQNDTIAGYNSEIQKIFQEKAEAILQGTTSNTTYEVKYSAFLWQNILSVVIRSNLKEGNDPQRVIVQTYHYDLKNQKEVTIQDAIEKKDLDAKEATTKIQNEIKWKNNQAKKLQEVGYQVFVRDEESEEYKIENVTNFFFDEKGTLYVIYAYGNNSLTSELDVITF